MKKLVIAIAIITILTSCSGLPIVNTKYTLMERYNRAFCDVDKTNNNDGEMCWAASTSNMLGFAFEYDPKIPFDFFKSEHSNSPESIYNAFVLFFKSTTLEKEELLSITSFSGKKINKRMDLCIIGTLLIGKVINIGADKKLDSKIGHALTVYGFETKKGELYIFYVDSNDGVRKLYRERIKCKEGITKFMTGKYKNRIIDTIASLQIFESEPLQKTYR